MKQRTATSGVFWLIEGPDGSGKTTQLNMLHQHLVSEGEEVVLAREPGGTPWGQKIRDLFLAGQGELDPMAEVMLLFAAKAQLLREVIYPAYNAGKIILMDRHTDSMLAYQGGARMLGYRRLRDTAKAAELHFSPDFTVFIDTPFETCCERLAQRPTADRNTIDNFDDTYHRRVHRAYRDIVLHACETNRPHVVIDGAQTAEKMHRDILEHLQLDQKESHQFPMRD